MGLETSVHDLKTLVLSFHPVVAIETAEEERAEQLAAAAARELRAPLFTWTLTRGLRREGETAANRGTAQPLELLSHLRTLTVEGIFLLRDFARHLDDAAV